MLIDRKTLLFTAASTVKCTKTEAVNFMARLAEINIDRFSRKQAKHVAECEYHERGELDIFGADFFVDEFAADIGLAIAELLASTKIEHLDVTYCVCLPNFYSGSHFGGHARIYSDGKITQKKFLD